MKPESPAVVSGACDECGREGVKIWRRYKGKTYCVNCYKREFKRGLCPQCGMLSRLYKRNPNAVCGRCEYVGKPCVRCGRTEYSVGKITEYGPVCNACSPYFRAYRICDGCGKSSQRLNRVARLGGDRLLCPACSRADHATCHACGRYRLLESSADGRMLCSKCLELGDVPCPNCGKMMPAGAGKVCKGCYCSRLLQKRAELNCAAYVTAEMRQMFADFSGWLGETVGHEKAAITLSRYVAFFLEIERQWREVPREYAVLLKHFGPLMLRRSELPMRFILSKELMTVDETAKQEEAERRRIDAIIEGQNKSRVITAFHVYLNKRLEAGKTSLRSVRLALTPAARLMQLVHESDREKPTQKDLTTYLQKSPGQRAAISAFVGFLAKKYGLNLSLPAKDGRAAKKKKLLLEAELGQLLKSGGSGVLFQRKLIGTALAYFHGLPKKAVNSVPLAELKRFDGGGVEVAIKEAVYWLPEEVWASFNNG